MKYYRVPQELDGKQFYIIDGRHHHYISLVGGELFTKRECEKLGLAAHSIFRKFELIKCIKKTYKFFGARFELVTQC